MVFISHMYDYHTSLITLLLSVVVISLVCVVDVWYSFTSVSVLELPGKDVVKCALIC